MIRIFVLSGYLHYLHGLSSADRFSSGEDIEAAIKNIHGTSIAQIIPNRNNKKSKIKALKGISKWFEWQWLMEGQFAGYIQAKSLPNIGEWNNFSPQQIRNLSNTEIKQPQPIASTPSISQLLWTIPVPHTLDIIISIHILYDIIFYLLIYFI